MPFKNVVLSSVALILSLYGCSSSVSVVVTRLPAIDTSGIERVAVEPFATADNNQLSRQVALDLTNTVNGIILDINRFTLVSSGELARLRQGGENYTNYVDAILTGELTKLTVKDVSRQDERTGKDGKTYYVTVYNREVGLEFTYRLIRSRDGSVMGQFTKSKTDVHYWKESRDELTPPRDMARMFTAELLRNMSHDFVPYTAVEYRTLMKDTTKDDRMKEAAAQVKNKNYQLALNIYKTVYQETGNIAAGYNAAIFTEALGDLEGAIVLMQQLVHETGNPDASVSLNRMLSNSAANRIIAEKYSSDTNNPILSIVKQAARDVSAQLPGNATISILNTSANEKQLAEYIIEQLITEIIERKQLTVVDRQNFQLIRAEQTFQLSGDVSDESAISIGHILGAEIVVTCSIAGSSNLRRLFIRALNVETAAIVYQNSLEI
jgi:hypothetical protein